MRKPTRRNLLKSSRCLVLRSLRAPKLGAILLLLFYKPEELLIKSPPTFLKKRRTNSWLNFKKMTLLLRDLEVSTKTLLSLVLRPLGQAKSLGMPSPTTSCLLRKGQRHMQSMFLSPLDGLELPQYPRVGNSPLSMLDLA